MELNEGDACLSDSSCSTGNCRDGRCLRGGHGQPCNAAKFDSCSPTHVCAAWERCEAISKRQYFLPDTCRSDADCDRRLYCRSGKCMRKKHVDELCETDSQCDDGLSCHERFCKKRCWKDYQCPGLQRCNLSPTSYSLCYAKIDGLYRDVPDNTATYVLIAFLGGCLILFLLAVLFLVRKVNGKTAAEPSGSDPYPSLPHGAPRHCSGVSSVPIQAEAPPMYFETHFNHQLAGPADPAPAQKKS